MAGLADISLFLDSTLEIDRFKDVGLNGLIVESEVRDITRIACAVDSGLSLCERAVREAAQLLIVHHGLFWGTSLLPLRGPLGSKISTLMRGGCSLYAAHLPLDGHPTLGNGALIAQFFGVETREGFCLHHGMPLGVKGSLPAPVPRPWFSERARDLLGAVPHPTELFFGTSEIRTVGVVTGSGSSAITAAAEAGLDLLISGEPKHEAYHLAKELRLNALFVGHYATETVGVLEVGRLLAQRFGVETIFLDEATGI